MKVEDFTSIHPRSFRHCSFEVKKAKSWAWPVWWAHSAPS